MLEPAPVVELHALAEPFTAFGRYWRQCGCGAVSPGYVLRRSIDEWTCPREDAEVIIAANREEFRRAQLADPRR